MRQNRRGLLKLGLLPLLLFGSILTCNASDESHEAQHLLERMMHSVNELNYQGTFIYLHNDQIELM
ncbi:MAG: hypothetical protein L3J28_14860, partial [Candidatus Polarisedimenticolaceae bacterium]|nr:hypothetical protein [Candidatus Polarisedimenticolaceae bacterium]